jgi:hypothetical protein
MRRHSVRVRPSVVCIGWSFLVVVGGDIAATAHKLGTKKAPTVERVMI